MAKAASASRIVLPPLAAVSVLVLAAVTLSSAQVANFREVAARRAISADAKPQDLEKVCPAGKDRIAKRVLADYGAMFVATPDVTIPPTCYFQHAGEVAAFQSKLQAKSLTLGATEIQLQTAAMDALERALNEAASRGLRISPLDGRIAARRSFYDTIDLWNSRFYRGLEYWRSRGDITQADADAATKAPMREQVERVMDWEDRGLFFSTDLTRSIFYSIAPPGTSQHLSMLALDVVEHGDPEVRSILNRHGWFQTIRTDRPHFTYLGMPERELPSRGLRNVVYNGYFYWIPAL